jgi:hypothetical protein
LSFSLPLEQTTPVTEAVENGVDEGIQAINDISGHVQRAISLATTAGTADDYLIESSRLGLAVLRGIVSGWSTAANGLGLIVAGEVEWWWSDKLVGLFNGLPALQGVATASVMTVPDMRPIDPQFVRVAGMVNGSLQFIDRNPGVSGGWDHSCYIVVRQHGGFIPSAIRVDLELVDVTGAVAAANELLDTKLSLP